MSKLKREDIKNKITSVEAGPWSKACTTYYEDREKYRALKAKLNEFDKQPANAKLVLELDQNQLNMKIQGSENADKN